MDVGIRELKSHLSELLDRVAAGEVLTVTDRGVPKARIVPVDGISAIERGRAEGWITRQAAGAPGPFRPRPPAPGTPTTDEIIADDRNE